MTAPRAGDLFTVDMHADYGRSDARDKCTAAGARLPLHAEICTSAQRLHAALSADGSALGGDKWIPVRTPGCEDARDQRRIVHVFPEKP